jgi:membrane-associated protease RseP (regulator of RpoE activity)
MTIMVNQDSTSSFFDILEIVKTEFQVKDSYLEGDIPTFIIAPEPHIKEKIKRIRFKIRSKGLEIILHRSDDGLKLRAVSFISHIAPAKGFFRLHYRKILFIATIITVTISGYFNASNYISLLNILGTFGAIIRKKIPPLNRDELFDIGFSGPFIGFLISLLVSYLGYSWSIPVSNEEYALIESTVGSGQTILLPALFMALRSYIFPNQNSFTYFLHPIAIAGWLGTLLTFLNTFPIGQLDGGHVSRAVLGPKWHRMLSYVMTGVMFITGWWVMALLVIFLLNGRHPEILDDISPLSRNRKILSLLLIVIFASCFTLSPDISPLLYG